MWQTVREEVIKEIVDPRRLSLEQKGELAGPVQAGSEGGEFYVYECDECHAMEIVGGNRINYSSS